MNIQQLKSSVELQTGIAIPSLDMKRETKKETVTEKVITKSENGVADVVTIVETEVQTPLPWFRYWDNINRLAIVMHEDIFMQLRAAKRAGNVNSLQGLALKPIETVTAASGNNYRRVTVITPQIDESF